MDPSRLLQAFGPFAKAPQGEGVAFAPDPQFRPHPEVLFELVQKASKGPSPDKRKAAITPL